MKLKKYLSSLLAIALLASCSNEGILDNNNTPIDNVPEGAVEFTLSFPGRTFQPTTYGDNVQTIRNGTFAAADHEKALSHVDVFVFENNSQNKPGKLASINGVRFTSNEVSNLEVGKTGATGKFFVRNISGKVHLVATANLLFDDAKKKSLIGKSFSEIANTLITQSPGKPNFFPMVSEPKAVTVPNTGTAVPNHVSFLLERLSVRIDVVNESGTMFDGNKLKLHNYRIPAGALNQSYLMNTLETPLANGDTKGTKYVNQLERISFTTDPQKQQALSQIYIYENGSDEFVLNISVMINNQQAYIDVPFNQPLVRNTRYLVTLTATPDNKIGATVEVKDWNKGEDVIFNASDLINELKIEKFEKTTGDATWTPNNKTLSIGKDGSTMRLVLKGNIPPKVEVKGTMIPWVKFEETSLVAGEADANADVKAYNLTFNKNFDSYPRKAKLVLGTEGNQNDYEKTVIEVSQGEQPYANIQNPLAILSKYYVSEVGKFDEVEGSYTDERQEGGNGMVYQFGRNNHIDYSAPKNIDSRQIPVNSPLLQSGPANTFYGGGSLFWTNEAVTADTKWQDLVNNSGAGTDYIGRNTVVEGDPSPDGFKIPNLKEIVALFPKTTSFKPNSASNVKTINEGKVSFLGKEEAEDYSVKYKEAGNGVVYAIRMIGNGDKYRTAFRYELKQNTIKITSRWLGKVEGEKPENAITEVSTEEWWNKNNGGDITRVYQKLAVHFGNFSIFLNEIVVNKGVPYFRVAVMNNTNMGCYWSSMNKNNVILPIRAK